MHQILIVEASPRGAASASRALTLSLIERLKEQYPSARFINPISSGTIFRRWTLRQ
jgi:FMN-dependent NADH-azoreductase